MRIFSTVFVTTAILMTAPATMAGEWFHGIQAERLEWRSGEGEPVNAWDFDGFIGTDEYRLVLRSEAEYDINGDAFETLENQLRIQAPVSPFFDAVLGVRHDSPDGEPNRTHGVIGLKGLGRQWFEIDADLYLSRYPSARFEIEYEGLITNYITFIPSIEVDLPLADDERTGRGAFAPTLEVGGRISYDLIDRSVSPYVGLHWERVLGESGRLVSAEGEDDDVLSFVLGLRVLF